MSRLAIALGAIAVAVVFASALVAYEAVSRSPAVSVAGEAKMQMLRDEHALIASQIAADLEARKLANATADNEVSRMRLAAQGEAQRQARVAATEQAKHAPAVELKTVAWRTPERAAPSTTTSRAAAVAGPLPMQQTAQVAAPPPVQARSSDGPVRSRLRELASDVRRIPSLLQSAAGWVVDAMPAPKLPGLPTRQFSALI